MRTWGKLGYPRRALRLHEAALADRGAARRRRPGRRGRAGALPGVGTYTARAVASFGYGQRQPVVDTNVRRVVARLVHGRADAGIARAADLADVAALLPADVDAGGPLPVAADGARGAGLHGRHAAVRGLPGPHRARGGWPASPARGSGAPAAEVRRDRPAGARPAARRAPGRRRDRVRARLDAAWDDAVQRGRWMGSLLADGLVEQTADGRFTLPQS